MLISRASAGHGAVSCRSCRCGGNDSGVIGEEYADPCGDGRITVVESTNEPRIHVLETSGIHGYLRDTSGGCIRARNNKEYEKQ